MRQLVLLRMSHKSSVPNPRCPNSDLYYTENILNQLKYTFLKRTHLTLHHCPFHFFSFSTMWSLWMAVKVTMWWKACPFTDRWAMLVHMLVHDITCDEVRRVEWCADIIVSYRKCRRCLNLASKDLYKVLWFYFNLSVFLPIQSMYPKGFTLSEHFFLYSHEIYFMGWCPTENHSQSSASCGARARVALW